MSKKNSSSNDILEEFSPDSQGAESIDEITSKLDTDTVKTLEQLEYEKLQDISQGKLSDFAINYSSYTNKPNKILENPKTANTEYYSGDVVKISSRPDFKDKSYTRQETSITKHALDGDNEISGINKTDSHVTKAKRDYARSHNEISEENFNSMSEMLQRAKAKKQLQISEMNAKYKKILDETSPSDSSTDTQEDFMFSDEDNHSSISAKKSKKKKKNQHTKSEKEKPQKQKKSILQRIVDYYTVPIDDKNIEDNSIIDETNKNISDISISDSIDVQDAVKIPESTISTTKKKESAKEFLTDLFTSKDGKLPRKKESFKERMIEFFTVQDDEEDVNPNIEITINRNSTDETIVDTEISKIPINDVESEVTSLLNSLVDGLSDDNIKSRSTESIPLEEERVESIPSEEEWRIESVPPVEEERIESVPPVEEERVESVPPEEEEHVESAPSVEKECVESVPPEEEERVESVPPEEEERVESVPPEEEERVESVPSVEEEHVELIPSAEEERFKSLPEKKTNIFKRIKMFFLMEELQQIEESDEETISESLKVERIDDSLETDSMKKSPEIEKTEESSINSQDYIMPLNEDAPNESIDIPIDEPIRYKHFWQDPNFNPVDRFKTSWSDATERYKNRKRSGEIHIEIKSNPETAILISDLQTKVLEEQRRQKSREEYQKQILNGEYDDFKESINRDVAEPVFTNAPSNDYTSYEDTAKVQSTIFNMKNSLLIRTIITAVLCVLSILITIPNDLEFPIIEIFDTSISSSGYLMVQSALGLIAIVTSIRTIISGIAKVFKYKADSDSFSSLSIVMAFVATMMTFCMSRQLVEDRMLNVYMPIALLGLLFNLIGKLLIVKREQNNFKYISKNIDKFGVFCIQDDYDAEKITKGLVNDYPVTTYRKKTHFTTDFIKYTYSYDMSDRFSRYAVPMVCIVSLVVSIVSAIAYNSTFDMLFPIGFISILSMLLSFCSCYSLPICINSMLYNVSKKYAKYDGAVLGYQAVEDFYDTNSIIMDSKDIFPRGSINVSALKLFSNAKIDETLIYAISLSNEANSILAPTLLKMLDGNLEMLREVENCSYQDGLGLCGWIDNKRVLMGNRELMESHNIENLPTKSKEMELVGSNRDCVYISVSGNLALMLILEIVPNKQVKRNLRHLQSSKIAIAVTSCDFLVSVSKISHMFDIDEDAIKIIPYELFQETKEYFNDKSTCSTSIVTNANIGMLTNLILSTKKIHRRAVLSNVLNAVSCILGIIIGVSFITMGGFRELTSTMILIYNLACTGVIMLLCNNNNS